MFHNWFAPEGGHPTWEENLIEKISKCKVLFLSHTRKLNQQKQHNVVSKSTENIYPSNRYDFFPRMFIIDQSRSALLLKYCAELPSLF